MEAEELMAQFTKSTEEQLRVAYDGVERHIDATDRIVIQKVTEAVSAASLQVIADPTT